VLALIPLPVLHGAFGPIRHSSRESSCCGACCLVHQMSCSLPCCLQVGLVLPQTCMPHVMIVACLRRHSCGHNHAVLLCCAGIGTAHSINLFKSLISRIAPPPTAPSRMLTSRPPTSSSSPQARTRLLVTPTLLPLPPTPSLYTSTLRTSLSTAS
jgi:hypothetical protein